MFYAERVMAPRSAREEPGNRDRAPWSLAARLTGWYVVSAFALVLIVTGGLYWALVNSLAQAEDEILLNKVHVLSNLLTAPQPNEAVIAQEIGEDTNAPRRTYVRVLSAAGSVLRESAGMSAEVPPEAFASGRHPSMADVRGTTVRGPNGRPLRTLAMLLRDSGAEGRETLVQVAADITSDQRLLARYRTDLAFALAVALLVCGGAGYQIVHSGLRPVRLIAQAAEDIGASTLDRRLKVSGLPSELRSLAATFNAMLQRLDESFSRLRQFSDDIAHELRTPINRVLIANEVALGQARTPDEYRDVLASNIDACGRLSQMVQSLLFLARSQGPQSRIERETIDVAHELSAIREFYEPLASEAGLELAVGCDGGLMAQVERSLLRRAIGNLIANSIAHTPRGRAIRILGKDDGASMWVEVVDTGQGIAPEHLPHVFDRFYRADQNRSTTEGHLGLGLSIVKSIALLHGGSVEIESVVGQGTTVRIRLPKTAQRASA
ncbi:MAG TPA: heavy metal sensor histidine kinase [Xanthobacteraceae bacterium]|nr:heavy metal sensor histidine kinase [Xanthobacteraceae bacterium]